MAFNMSTDSQMANGFASSASEEAPFTAAIVERMEVSPGGTTNPNPKEAFEPPRRQGRQRARDFFSKPRIRTAPLGGFRI